MLSDSGATCAVTAQAGPDKMERQTRHGSLGRGTLILGDCPGSMMGNKSSVISGRGGGSSAPHDVHRSGLTPVASGLRRRE